MKIIIVGDGKTGYYLSGLLSADHHDVAVIDASAAALRLSENTQDVITYLGDALDVELLKEAGIATADLLIAVTKSDEVNVLCCMLAGDLGTPHTIARVRSPEITGALSVIWQKVGLSLSVNPEMDAATEISRRLVVPSSVKVNFFAKGRVEMAEYTVTSDSPLCGLRLSDIPSKLKLQILVCAVVRGDEISIPTGASVIEAGDRIGIAAKPSQIAAFFALIDPSRNRKPKTVTIIGGGTVSYYLARLLIDNGMRVRIIEEDQKRCTYLSEALPKAMIVHGDGTDQQMLSEEGLLDGCDALVALTNMDEENIVISMNARMQGIGKVIARINHTQLSALISKIELKDVITPHVIAAGHVLRYVRAMQSSHDSNVEALSKIMDGKAEALEFLVSEGFAGAGIPLRDLRIRRGYLIACILRDRQTIFPKGDDVIRPGDSVIVVTTKVGLNKLSDIMG